MVTRCCSCDWHLYPLWPPRNELEFAKEFGHGHATSLQRNFGLTYAFHFDVIGREPRDGPSSLHIGVMRVEGPSKLKWMQNLRVILHDIECENVS